MATITLLLTFHDVFFIKTREYGHPGGADIFTVIYKQYIQGLRLCFTENVKKQHSRLSPSLFHGRDRWPTQAYTGSPNNIWTSCGYFCSSLRCPLIESWKMTSWRGKKSFIYSLLNPFICSLDSLIPIPPSSIHSILLIQLQINN